ncbi:hypothetical protein [Paraburkholderia gardini]|uniref:Lipoprotein n=1 Tax=Paraburkholderia gardini TaxID=2823469 RepID=A0ABM8U6X3_9BURK|nr:hypothetical protein [Paraburkholderia gardini]CAG4902831.1 hypothetical protein R69919_02988 [Paraburkholderia gardini]CAG4910327.1 hypothetical protein R54767_03683 [Paraburkholderia gardini]
MKKIVATLSIPLFLAACAQFQNPDAGDPVADQPTQRSVSDVVNCLTEQARKHNAQFKTTSIPQGSMLDFGDSNIVKVRADNGATQYRFYAGERHVDNLWLESATRTCAP